MGKYIINGGRALNGSVRIHGAKNAVLPILAASVITGSKSVIHDCPDLSDVEESIKILNFLGCETVREGNTICVNSENIVTDSVPEYLMLKMRSSVIFLGALISRCRSGRVSLPGGCEIGPRPIDLHLKAFREMGIEINESGGIISCNARNMHGANIHLDFPSVGATENIMLAATGAKGDTLITNAAKEPEIVDLQSFLNEAGYCVHGAGTDRVYITGLCTKPRDCEHIVIPDRIEAATYICAALMCTGEVEIKNVREEHMGAFLSALKESTADIKVDDGIRVNARHRLKAVKRIRTYPYPGFPTDMQSVFMGLMTLASGTSLITENIFHDRFRHVDGLVRMGADIVTDGNVAIVKGVPYLNGAHVKACDLRGGAALTIAAAAAKGNSEIENLCYIDRGYEKFEINLQNLGVDIQRK